MFNFIDKQSDLDTVNYIAKSVDIEVLEKALNKTKLVPKVITDKNGHRRTVWVLPTKKQPNQRVSIEGAPKEDPKEHKQEEEHTIRVHEITDAKEFNDVFLKARDTVSLSQRWRVSKHDDLDDYKNCKMYATDGGSTFAVRDDGDIISVCVNKNDLGTHGKDLIKKAIELGGKKLDCYSGIYKFYVKCGLTPVACVDGNKEYTSDEWKEARRDTLLRERKKSFSERKEDDSRRTNVVHLEDVVFFVVNPKSENIPMEYTDFKSSTKQHFDKDSYELGEEFANKLVTGDKV